MNRQKYVALEPNRTDWVVRFAAGMSSLVERRAEGSGGMKTAFGYMAVVVAVLWATGATPCLGESGLPKGHPDYTKGEKLNQGGSYLQLGSTGIVGWFWASNGTADQTRQIAIKEITPLFQTPIRRFERLHRQTEVGEKCR